LGKVIVCSSILVPYDVQRSVVSGQAAHLQETDAFPSGVTDVGNRE